MYKYRKSLEYNTIVYFSKNHRNRLRFVSIPYFSSLLTFRKFGKIRVVVCFYF